MRKSTKIWLIVAACLVIAGIMMCVGAAAAAGFDLHKFSTVEYTEKTVTVKENFDCIDIDVSAADIELKHSDDKQCRIICREPENSGHSAEVKGKTLTVREADDRKWYERFGISFDSPKITVCLPKDRYDSVTVKTLSGDVEIPGDFTFKTLRVTGTTADIDCAASVTDSMKMDLVTGDIRLSDLKAGSIELSGVTGDVLLDSVKVKGSLRIETTTGDIRFDSCDAGEIHASATTGDITGTLLTGKAFSAHTDTGDVSVPPSTDGGKCELSAVTGDIRIEIR